MRRRLLARRPSPAMVVALIALLSSMVGGAAAATLIDGGDIQNGSVGTKDITNGGVTKKDIKRNAVRTKHVQNGSLVADDFAANELPEGPKGDKGDPGTDGATNVTTRVVTASLPVGNQTQTASCNAGEKAVGGGFSIANAPEPEVEGYETHPSPTTDGSTPTGWTTLFTITGIPHTVSTYVICASP